jgi:hypothetical protein
METESAHPEGFPGGSGRSRKIIHIDTDAFYAAGNVSATILSAMS